ncbi:unnamed protein product [Triticum turgidum subsp. durum]|uniref:4-hydroxy-7-methoxy-3-oxo-3,4-dihydro-2H-1,4-benzoxazin-2-yl glucosidebeta-D-glucosidase n=1 Tax=Triticum turgidum subsp. durum TaxID=4567 RepID=A0A9R1PC38_TRITD|nr:unnamed protein product [Triticum turgidum subsp. durum]
MHELLSSNLPKFTSEEKSLLRKNKADFIGINHYTTIYVKDCISSPCDLNTYETYEGNALVLATGERDGVAIGKPVRTTSISFAILHILFFSLSHMFVWLQTAFDGYYDVPEGMEQIVKYVNQRYKNTPVYVTENGYSQHSNNTMDELINDVERVNYLQGYLTCLSSAVRKGANVRGYFVWSIIDNFEWTFGFTVRFGLYHVDYETQKRTPKMSAKWYRDFLMGSRPTDQVQTLRADS